MPKRNFVIIFLTLSASLLMKNSTSWMQFYLVLKVYESWGEEFQEWHAYTTQVIYNPYWIFTTPVFQAHIMNTYGQYIDNIIKGMGGK